jgi:chromosome segregation ATPase
VSGGAGRYELDLIAALNRIGVPMMTEEDSRYRVLVENYETFVRAIGEALHATNERVDRMESKFENRFDALDAQLIRVHVEVKVLQTDVKVLQTDVKVLQTDVKVLQTDVKVLQTDVKVLQTQVDKLTTKVDGLEVFAGDTQGRLKRIETHLQLSGSRRSTLQRKAARTSLRKRPRSA